MLEANPTRLFRLLAAQPGLGAALVAAAVTEAADAAEAEASRHAGGGGGGEEPGELWLVTLLDALLARLLRPGRADGRRAQHVRLAAARWALGCGLMPLLLGQPAPPSASAWSDGRRPHGDRAMQERIASAVDAVASLPPELPVAAPAAPAAPAARAAPSAGAADQARHGVAQPPPVEGVLSSGHGLRASLLEQLSGSSQVAVLVHWAVAPQGDRPTLTALAACLTPPSPPPPSAPPEPPVPPFPCGGDTKGVDTYPLSEGRAPPSAGERVGTTSGSTLARHAASPTAQPTAQLSPEPGVTPGLSIRTPRDSTSPLTSSPLRRGASGDGGAAP